MTSADRQVVPFPRAKVPRGSYEVAFLPAALEITETPPSPIGRAIGATIIAIFCAALLWASIGRVDIVASARGKIVPVGRTRLVQPLDAGVVKAIHIRDGQRVKAGEVLIELDPTMTRAEQDHIKGDLISADLDVARLRAELAWEADPDTNPVGDYRPPAGASPAQIETQQKYLISETSELKAKLAEIDRQRAKTQAEGATIAAGVTKLKALTPLVQQRVTVRKTLLDKGLASKLQYLTEDQDLVGMQQDVLVQQDRLRESEAALAALGETRRRTQAEFRSNVFSELNKAEVRAAELAQDAVKAERQTKLQELRAPIDGVVQQLAVHTVGGVVTPAQALAVIVPDDSAIEIEAMLSNRDIGFVHAGQKAEIKLDTFNFTRYGLLHGVLTSVSPDAVRSEAAANGRDGGAASAANDAAPNGQDLHYVARIALDRTHMRVDGRTVDLTPGMQATVEIKTGSRKVISYLLSPVEKSEHDSLHER